MHLTLNFLICLFVYMFIFSLLFGAPGDRVVWFQPRLSKRKKKKKMYVCSGPAGSRLPDITGCHSLARREQARLVRVFALGQQQHMGRGQAWQQEAH